MNNILLDKSFNFALRVVKLSEYSNKEKQKYVLARKILDAGTNIGLFVEESQQGEDRKDFIQKLSLANKEAFKTHFVLRLLEKSGYLTESHAASMIDDCIELKKLFVHP
ncbi:four helix bundle protein [Leptolyngbya sp. 7M]|uniref:four helix bundle protein n=1 Tax=Leptolyngbya sp. 7M TaxID=2812896 RepID=UPI001B8B6483|nr:four helix bundle protein [Leptolyngbya sp. 7M]QYO64895.1 four helix bundle protein [Leptolyngbya sp. 7M]